MNVLCSLIALAGLSLSIASYAAELTAQQKKMSQCHQQARSQSLKGDERKSFMSQCLKKESHVATMTPQQMKMKNCNSAASTKSLKGELRKTFMSACLKKG